MTGGIQTIRKVFAAIAIVGMLAGAVAGAIYLVTQGSRTEAIPTPVREALATPTASMPTPDEFTVTVDVTEHRCPTPQNCTYLYSIRPDYHGMHPLPEQPFTVEYQVIGGHQPQPGSFEVSNGEARTLRNVAVDGPPDARLRAKVIRVAPIAGPPVKPAS